MGNIVLREVGGSINRQGMKGRLGLSDFFSANQNHTSIPIYFSFISF